MKKNKSLFFIVLSVFIASIFSSYRSVAQDVTVESMLKIAYPDMYGKYKIEATSVYDPATKNQYRELFKKLEEGHAEVVKYQKGGATEDNLLIFNYKEIKSLDKAGKLNDLSTAILTHKRSISTLMFGKEQYGADSLYCLKSLSLFSEYMTQNNYDEAYNSWTVLFNEYPMASKNIYIRGLTLVKDKIKKTETAKDDVNKEKWIDTLFRLYDQRIQFYGTDPKNGKGYLLGNKGIDMLLYRSKTVEDFDAAYKTLMESIEIEGENSTYSVILSAMKACYAVVAYKKYDCATAVDNYIKFGDLISKQIKKAKASGDADTESKLVATQSDIDKFFIKTGCATCEKLSEAFTPRFNADPKNVEVIKKILEIFTSQKCEDTELYEKCAETLFPIEPSTLAAYSLAKIKIKKTKYEEAFTYYEKTLTLSDPADEKLAQYYYEAALVAFQLNSTSKAKEYANKAISINANYGAAYLVIAKLVAQTYCSDDFDNRAKYWVAVDKALRAKSVDPSVEEDANKLINAYSGSYPNKEVGFMKGIYEGSTYTVGCLGESTTVRY